MKNHQKIFKKGFEQLEEKDLYINGHLNYLELMFP